MPSDMMTQVELHLNKCDSCRSIYNAQLLADRIISFEKETEPDPFLLTRVMARIENLENEGYEKEYIKLGILRPALIAVSLAAAVFLGIMLGGLSRHVAYEDKVPIELALINDASLESVEILSIE